MFFTFGEKRVFRQRATLPAACYRRRRSIYFFEISRIKKGKTDREITLF